MSNAVIEYVCRVWDKVEESLTILTYVFVFYSSIVGLFWLMCLIDTKATFNTDALYGVYITGILGVLYFICPNPEEVHQFLRYMVQHNQEK